MLGPAFPKASLNASNVGKPRLAAVAVEQQEEEQQEHEPQAHEPAVALLADEIDGPDDPGRARRLAWSDLLRRVWQTDVLSCPKCGGRMRLVATVWAPEVCEKILRHLGLWSRGPPRGRRVVVEPADRESCSSD